MSQSLLWIAALIGFSAFFSLAEISLAASRRLRLQQLAADGDPRAAKVLQILEQPSAYFTTIQVGVNALAILGGIVGEGALSPAFEAALSWWLPPATAQTVAFAASFVCVMSAFILFADLFPKRLGMNEPERFALRLVGPMGVLLKLCMPLVWIFSQLNDLLFRIFGLPARRDERITPDDILALAEAGAQAGVLAVREQQVITNIVELENRPVTSAMTPRDRIAFFLRDDPDTLVRARIASEAYSTYPVCDHDVDHVIGTVDAKDILQRVLSGQPIGLSQDGLLRKVLVVPDRLSLAEVLDQFRQVQDDFAVIVNEYSLVVGVVTLNDVMSTVMGDLVAGPDEEQIVRRDDSSWLIDGMTAIQDVQRALMLDELPFADEYETLAGFLMVMLRRVPRRTDTVDWGGYRFEVLDVDSYRIDQVMVTRIDSAPVPPVG